MADQVMLISSDADLVRKVQNSCSRIQAELTIHPTLHAAAGTLEQRMPDLVLCNFADFQHVRRDHPTASVCLIAEPADSEQAIEAIKHGALDYLVRPITSDDLAEHIRAALRISRDVRVPAVYEDRPEDVSVDRIVGQSPAMKEVYKLIGLIAPRDINVLITGESGTGKEVIARAILHHSPRKDKPYLAVNCAAIPETLLESELFGHEKGAFTGADLRRIGKFEQCHTGTLLLDEIGDIPLATQAKLLRVLQDRKFQRLGGSATIQSDVRIIAATHQPLERLIQEGRFRQDLYYRLNVASIHLPALRDREVDVVLLAHHFVARSNREFGANVRSFAPDALPALLRYPWPGNVRELENVIKSSLVVARGSVFRLEYLPEHIRSASQPTQSAGAAKARQSDPAADLRRAVRTLAADPAKAGTLYRASIEALEQELIRAALEKTNGRLAPAARLLGVTRLTLRKKITTLGLQITTTIASQNKSV